MTWNEAVNTVMGQPPRIPSLEVGIRLKDSMALLPQLNTLRSLAEQFPHLADDLKDWPLHNVFEVCDRLTRIPFPSANERRIVDNCCRYAGDVYQRWLDYDNAYQIAQTVVLEAARRETLKVFASVSAKKASKTYDVPVGQLAAPGKIDMDRKHLVSATHGETYPTLSLAPNDRAVFYNVQISEPDFKAAKTRLTKLHKHHLGQSPSKTPLKINKDIEHWFKLYSNPFSMAETTPTEAQLCLALRLEWGDQTQHRDVARNLIRFVPRAMGAPKKSARNQRS